ncbi:MAG: hypothetical protein ACYSOT_02675 [Planctomycetota bacterium]
MDASKNVMPDSIRHPDGNALDPGSGAGVTLRVNWVCLGLFFWKNGMRELALGITI